MTDLANIENPTFFKMIEEINYERFEKKVYENRNQFIKELKQGKIFIVKNVLSCDIIDKVKDKTHNLGIQTPREWHDPIFGVPNFHQIDDKSPYFKTKKCAHVFHFFNWNKDELEVFKYFDNIIKLFNFINGNSEKIEKDLINRLQIHHYPKGAGFMDYHVDPDTLVKTLAILYMSEYGQDYSSGGLNLLNHDSDKILIDEKVKKGDMIFAYPSIEHGCDLIESEKPVNNINWEDPSGRWLFLLNTLKVKIKNG